MSSGQAVYTKELITNYINSCEKAGDDPWWHYWHIMRKIMDARQFGTINSELRSMSEDDWYYQRERLKEVVNRAQRDDAFQQSIPADTLTLVKQSIQSLDYYLSAWDESWSHFRWGNRVLAKSPVTTEEFQKDPDCAILFHRISLLDNTLITTCRTNIPDKEQMIMSSLDRGIGKAYFSSRETWRHSLAKIFKVNISLHEEGA